MGKLLGALIWTERFTHLRLFYGAKILVVNGNCLFTLTLIKVFIFFCIQSVKYAHDREFHPSNLV